MPNLKKTDTEVQPSAPQRAFPTEYKRRIVAEADQRKHGDLGVLLWSEGLYYSQISDWRKGVANGTLGTKKCGSVADPNRVEKRRLERDNKRLRRKLAALLERLNVEDGK